MDGFTTKSVVALHIGYIVHICLNITRSHMVQQEYPRREGGGGDTALPCPVLSCSVLPCPVLAYKGAPAENWGR